MEMAMIRIIIMEGGLMKLTEIHPNKHLASLLACIILLLGVLPPFTNAVAAPPPDDPAANLGGSTTATPPAESIVITLQTPPYQVTAGGDGFDLLQVEGFDPFGAPGDPALPGKIYNVAVPPDVSWESVTVEVLRAEAAELPGSHEIAPAPPPVTWVDGQKIVAWGENAASIVDGRNTKVYQDDAYFPSSYVTPVAQSQMRKWRFVRLLFTPLQYNPVSKKLRLATEVEVRLTFERAPAIQAQQIQAELSDTVMDDEAAQILYNYGQARDWYQADEPLMGTSAGDGYAIITTNAIVAASSKLSDFIAHKQAQGYTVEVVTESQYGGLSGQSPNGTAEKIRKWLQDNYSTIKYVLLIGNPDPDDPTISDSVGDVPMKMCWPRGSETSYRESPTDYFYADLTGNWNLDGDIYFGEYNGDRGTGGVDFTPEVYVGRIPVYTGVAGWAATLDSILQKTIDYDNSSDTAWRKSALLPMSFSDSSTDGARLAEAMKSGYLNGGGYTSYTLYQQGTSGCDSTYSSNETLLNGAVRNRWQSNDYGVVTWWGHGNETGAYIGYDTCGSGTILTSSDTSSLDDGHPAFVYQCSCTNGYPENSNNLGYALLKQGAIATVSASRVSWYAVGWSSPSPTYADNASIGYYFMQQIVNEDPAGKALYDEKSAMGAGWGSASWMNLMDFNVYGDPSASILSSGCQDAYEPDNNSASARWITVNGAAQTHNFHENGDVDWAKFAVTAGSAYTITTSNLGGNDTVLYLYDTDGTTELASNDDCPGSAPASCINNYIATVTGTYFITTSHSSGVGGCTGYNYDLSVVDNSTAIDWEIILPFIVKGACSDTQVVQNGGFESGRTIWVQSSSTYYIIGNGLYYRTYNGYWSAWFGGYDYADDRLYQTISIPPAISSARLVIYLYVYTTDSISYRYDYFHAELQNSSGGTLESFLWADNTMSNTGWYVGTMSWSDFSAHAGQTRRLFFRGTTDDSYYTNFFVDDVTLWTYCGGLPAGGGGDSGSDGWTWEKVEGPPGYTPGKAATGPKGQ
jgi:hypothetical protein